MNEHVGRSFVLGGLLISIEAFLTYTPSYTQLLLSQQEAISISSLNQMHGLWSVGEVVGFRHYGQDGHFPSDIARFTLTVNDQECHSISTFLHLRKKADKLGVGRWEN